MHYYQHHIGDYRKDTSHLNLLEHGIYRQLLDWYYLDESPLPSDIKKLRRAVSARKSEEKDALDNVLADFFKLEGKEYTHSRCDSELENIYEKSEKARASAQIRWDKKNGNNAKGMRKVCAEDANASKLDAKAPKKDANGMLPNNPLPNNPKPKPRINGEQALQIFDFWKTTMEHPRSQFDADRKRRINKWLKVGYSDKQLKMAIAGCKLTPWNMGENDRHKPFDGIEVVFKNAGNIDGFIETYERSRNG